MKRAANMGEIKSVKVDNWGVFFLQKLQNFFNKTDYCDLTLQFRDNSQLKVHRLVLSACTDYFNVLEQTCEMVDDAIIMPNELQADVVVPIVNFMYTGTLEFELKMYNRLLRTARDMNMTVLLKLLEAHRRTMELHPQKNQGQPPSPKLRRRGNFQTTANTCKTLPATISRGSANTATAPAIQRRLLTSNISTSKSGQNCSISQSARQVATSTDYNNSKQSTTQHTLQQSANTSPFEQLRKGYNNNKRPASTSYISPPVKKPNLEDVKEFAEQQRMRKQIAAEYGDDGDYEGGMMDDDLPNDDDDDDMGTHPTASPQATSTSTAVQTTTDKSSTDPPGTTTITVKHEGPGKPPTIIVKDNSNTKMNHARIISEVLRQYPHLVKSNKNIKVKIMPSTGGNTQKIIVKKEANEVEKPAVQQPQQTIKSSLVKSSVQSTIAPQAVSGGRVERVTGNVTGADSVPQKNTSIAKSVSMQQSNQKISAVSTTTTTASVATQPSQPQKRRIDSKTMHALIALGAENTTGPWLCLRCGRNGHPISIPSYRGFRRHLINTHKEVIDAALCEHCGWRSSSNRELHLHMLTEHKIRSSLYIFPECQVCTQICLDSDALNEHLIESHPEENKQQCIYCNKIFPEEMQLYTHMKTYHKKQALEDGIIDYSDDDASQDYLNQDDRDMAENITQFPEEKKIKILSDISLPNAAAMIGIENSAEPIVTTNTSNVTVAEEYTHEDYETKFLAADGTEMILTEEQRKEILSQLKQEHHEGGVVMVLNEPQLEQGDLLGHDETSQTTSQATNDDVEHDDSQIYNEMKAHVTGIEEEDGEAENGQDTATEEGDDDLQKSVNMDESKESMDNLEWAENLVTEHELANESSVNNESIEGNSSHKLETNVDTNTTTNIEQMEDDANERDLKRNDELEKKSITKSQDEISKKLKELTGDWTDDDEPDELDTAAAFKSLDESKETKSEPSEAKVLTPNVKDDLYEKQQQSDKDSKVDDGNIKRLANVKLKKNERTFDIDNDKKATIYKHESEDVDAVDLALKTLHKEDGDEMTAVKEIDSPEKNDDLNQEDKCTEVTKTEKCLEEHIKENNDNKDDIKSPIAEESKKDLLDLLMGTADTAEDDDNEDVNDEVDNIDQEDEDDSGALKTVCGSDDLLGTESTATKPTNKKCEKAHSDHGDVDDDDANDTETELPEMDTGKSKNTDDLSTEDRMKSLISEWGEIDEEDQDDEHEEPNEGDLTKKL